MFEHFDLLHGVAGLLVGFFVGLTGVGGGSLMTPLLVLLFGISPATAVGTDLLFAATTKIAGSAVHGWKATVDWRIVRRLAMGSVPAALITLFGVSYFGKVDGHTSKTIMTVLGVMLVVTSVATLFQKQLAVLAKRSEQRLDVSEALVPTVVLGALLGTAVTITSVGAGALGVTVLLMLYPGLRVARIVGSDIAHAVPLTLVAGLGHWFIGNVDIALLLNLLIGSIPGVIAGSLLSTRSPDQLLRPALAAVLMFSGYKLLS
jgi:uncharacterized membrane protein YfcA